MTARTEGYRDSDLGAGPILEAAAWLELKEFDLFALAHRWWFGRRAETRALERVFAAYMFRGVVPPWARHFAREVLREARAGSHDFTRFGLQRACAKPSSPRHRRLVLAALFTVYAVLFALILETAGDRGRWTAPPGGDVGLSCQGGGPGLKFFESLAYAIAERAPPACRDPG